MFRVSLPTCVEMIEVANPPKNLRRSILFNPGFIFLTLSRLDKREVSSKHYGPPLLLLPAPGSTAAIRLPPTTLRYFVSSPPSQTSEYYCGILASMLSTEGDSSRDIAIVGLSCRFAGDAKDVHGYWELLRKGKSTSARSQY